MRNIDLSDLPQKGKSINWIGSVGYKCKFIYDDIEGEVEIIDVHRKNNTTWVTYKYDDKINKSTTSNFSKCRIGDILHKKTGNFKIKIGTVIKDDKRNITIIDREYRKYLSGQNFKYYKYKCNKCPNEDWIEESKLINRIGCNVCGNNKTLNGYNDIPTTEPWMVKYFQGGYDEAKNYTYNSAKTIYPICPDCGRVKNRKIKIKDIYKYHSIGCICGNGISYPEKVMISVLNQLNINYIRQYSRSYAEWCKNYKYDFYLIDDDSIIEVNGEQHYKDTTWISYDDQHDIDVDKKYNAIPNINGEYIELDCRISDVDYIKYSMENNKSINRILDLSNVDWVDVNEFSTKNLVKEICEYYEHNKDKMTMKDIATYFKINRNTLTSYLKRGNELNWCNHTIICKKRVMCVETNEIFESVADCEKALSKRYPFKFSSAHISSVCNKKRLSHRGMHFKYIIDS